MITSLVHPMRLRRLPNLHIPFFIALHIIRALHSSFWNLAAGKTTGTR